jgi:hypothetical protein
MLLLQRLRESLVSFETNEDDQIITTTTVSVMFVFDTIIFFQHQPTLLDHFQHFMLRQCSKAGHKATKEHSQSVAGPGRPGLLVAVAECHTPHVGRKVEFRLVP